MVGLVLAAAPALAHHSTAPYDLVHGTILEGVVTRFDWENPHAHIYLDVSAEADVEHWSVEIEAPRILNLLGWTKNAVKPGDRISVTGGRAKNGSFILRGAYIQLPDGRKLPGVPPPQN